MKTNFFLFAICSALIFTSCSNDEEDEVQVSDMVSLVGTWELTSATGSLPVDLDMDGSASTNLLEELPCFEDVITANEDETYNRNATETDVNVEPGIPPVVTASCTGNMLMETGSWSLDGDQLTFTPSGMEPKTVTITLTQTTISFTDTLEDLGEIDLIFTKQ